MILLLFLAYQIAVTYAICLYIYCHITILLVFFMDCELKATSKGYQSRFSFSLIYVAFHYSMIFKFH